MKKLLGILGTITIAGSGMTGIVGNAPTKKEQISKNNTESNFLQTNNLKRNKRQTKTLSLSDYLEFNNKYIEKINGIPNNVLQLEIDNQNNVYFRTYNNGDYLLKNGETTATKIEGINKNIFDISIDKGNINNNIYIKDDTAYVLKKGETTATKIEGIPLNKKIGISGVDNQNNVYFRTYSFAEKEEVYVLKNGETTVTKIEGINEKKLNSIFIKNNYIFFNTSLKFAIKGTFSGPLYYLKSGETQATKIEGIIQDLNLIEYDNKNKIFYLGAHNGLFILKPNESKTIKIEGINENIFNILIDNDKNFYFAAQNNIYILNNEQNIFSKINRTDNYTTSFNFKIDKYNNLYFNTTNGVFLLKNKKYIANKIQKIEGINNAFNIDNQNNIYFSEYKNKENAIFILKPNGIINKIKLINWQGDNWINEIYVNNNDVFFSSKESVFKLNNDKKSATKIEGINILYTHSSNGIYCVFDKNNNAYFATSEGAYILEKNSYNAKLIKELNNKRIQSLFIKNDNVYFVTRSEFFKLNIKENKVVLFDDIYNHSSNFVVDNKDNIYFYKYEDDISGVFVLKKGETTATKIEGINDIGINMVDIENNIYFGTKNGVFVLKNGETTATKIEGINDVIDSIKIDNKNNIYFLVNNQFLFLLKNGETTATKIEGITEKNVFDIYFYSQIIINNENDVYFYNSYTGSIYMLKSNQNILNKIEGIEIDNSFSVLKFDKYQNIYFINKNKGAWFLKNNLEINYVIKHSDLEKIENNDDETILNNLNYLNHESNYFLNLNKMKIINKTPTSATIVATKGNYRGEVTVNYKIKNQDEISTINFNDLVKRAVYFDFIDKNYFSFTKLKEIKDINTNNLNFANVKVTRDSELLHSVNFKNACFEKKTYGNKSSLSKIIVIPPCEYNSKLKLGFQITTGLTKTKQENELNGWNISSDDEMKLHDFVNLNSKQSEIINELSNNFDLSNINKQEQEMIWHPFDKKTEFEAEIAPQEQAVVKYSVREIHFENTLNLKQKINGTITAKIIDDNNEEQTIILSIKEAMQILQKYSLLPDEITINEDNSITFNGKGKISLTQEGEPKLIINTSIV